jgi:hypothetical protein
VLLGGDRLPLLCRKRLHVLSAPGRCPECVRVVQDRYNRSEKGRARTQFQARVTRALDPSWPARQAAYQRRYAATHPAVERNRAANDAAAALIPGVPKHVARHILRVMKGSR